MDRKTDKRKNSEPNLWTYAGAGYEWQKRGELSLRGEVRLRLPYGDDGLEFAASRVGLEPHILQRIAEFHIARGHPTAVLVSLAADGRTEFYQLGIGCLSVVYSVENEIVVIRGVGPNLPTHLTEGTDLESGFTCDV